jgi:hypothetical protein
MRIEFAIGTISLLARYSCASTWHYSVDQLRGHQKPVPGKDKVSFVLLPAFSALRMPQRAM